MFTVSFRTQQDEKHGGVAQQRQDGDDPDDDPQGPRGHDVLTGVEVVWGRGADDGGGVGAVFPVEGEVVRSIGVGAQGVPPGPDTG